MTQITPSTVEELLDYWPGNIPFKGRLVSEDGSCMCAQGQVLHFLDRVSPDDLKNYRQSEADARVAELLGISRTHAVLLRVINDSQEGAPSSVIRNPEQVLGDQSQVLLAFWRHLDRLTYADWQHQIVGEAAWETAGASNEIQGAAIIRAKGQPFFFLPIFGFAGPEAVIAADSPSSDFSHRPFDCN